MHYLELDRHLSRRLRAESRDWLYFAIAGVVIGLLITLAPVVRAYASHGW